jgi:hypoxanthine-DNA glycosylase
MRGLGPRIGPVARVLILGSFPGARSLVEQRYYANPQNRFWRSVAPVCGLEPDAPYESRIAALNQAGIGLWDVLGACERRGSLDQSIVPGSEEPNDLGAVVEAHPELRAILLNGASVARLFHRHQVPRPFWDDLGVEIRILPSTSPAHARMRPEAVSREWREALASHL